MASTRHSITRRGLFRGLFATAATTATVGLLSGCSHSAGDATPEPTVVDSDAATDVLSTYSSQDFSLTEAGTWSLPLGSVLHEAEGTWIPVTQAGSSASPMVKGCAFSLSTGNLSEVVSQTIGTSNAMVIYDVRCSDSVYAWVELNYLTYDWTLYAAAFSNGTLSGTPSTLWQAGSDYDPPLFACTGSSVIWQVMPSTSGSKTSESSYCYIWKAGDANAKSVVESPGRFATAPLVSGDTITLTPRVRASEGTYYGVTAYSLSNDLGSIQDQLVLPETVKPFRAVRIGDKFVISIEATYSTGGLLSTMGTYIGSGSSTNDFLAVSREPFAAVAGKNGVYIVKVRASYVVLDTNNSNYSVLSASNRCVDYGEYPARAGQCDTFVTYATVKDENTGYPSQVTVRAFTL